MTHGKVLPPEPRFQLLPRLLVANGTGVSPWHHMTRSIIFSLSNFPFLPGQGHHQVTALLRGTQSCSGWDLGCRLTQLQTAATLGEQMAWRARDGNIRPRPQGAERSRNLCSFQAQANAYAGVYTLVAP